MLSEGAPPPLPGAEPAALYEGRLHPLTLAFAAWKNVRGIILPAVLVLAFGREKVSGAVLLFILILFVVLPLGLAVIRYFTFRYRLAGGELILEHGLVQRIVRHIPLERVQDIRIEQGVLHRLSGMADVHVETAGGRGPEASLSVLSRAEAERLRAAVFARLATAQSLAVTAGANEAPAVQDEIIRRLSLRDLVLAGLTSNRAASVLALLLVGWGLLDDVMPKAQYERLIARGFEQAQQWLEQHGESQWLVLAAGVAGFIFVGLLLSVIGSIVTFYGFTLARRGEDLHRTYGLLTRRSSSLPRKRIQVLKIEESWLRRLARLATLQADTAGGSPGQGAEQRSGRDALLPIVHRDEVEALLPVFLPDFDAQEAEWRRVSRRAIRRGTTKGVVVCALLAGALCLWQGNRLGLWLLVLIPGIYALNVMSYRRLGFALGEKYFRTRRGWLSRATHLVPVRNTQAVVVRQSPLDRWHGVATLAVDTAGQVHTGGGPKVGNVPLAEALTTARELARRASDTRYRW